MSKRCFWEHYLQNEVHHKSVAFIGVALLQDHIVNKQCLWEHNLEHHENTVLIPVILPQEHIVSKLCL